MIEHLVRFSLIIFLLCSGFLNAQIHPVKTVDSLLQKGIESLLHNNYDAALNSFEKLSFEHPELPFGDIYSAVTLIIKSDDYLIEAEDDRIKSLIESSEKKSERLIKKDDESVWNIYGYALSKGLKAYYYGVRESYLKAFDEGIEALELFQECIEEDDKFYEALIALGTYKYWKSIKLKPVLWMPFLEDEVEAGKNILEKNLDNSFYNKALAAYSLVWIYINDEEYPKAIQLSISYLNKYPKNRLFLWAKARALEETQPLAAVKTYENILDNLPAEGKTLNNIILLKHKMAMIYNKLGNNESALALSREILDVYSEQEISYDIKMRINRVKELKEKLEE